MNELASPSDPLLSPAYSRGVLEGALIRANILNASQRRNAYLKARDLHRREAVWRSVPFRLLVEFNRRCNVKCVHCDIKRKGTGELSLEILDRVLEEIGWGVQEIMPFGGGEPTLAPISQMAPRLRRYNIFFNFITNGILFTREFFESIADITARVQFSFHSHLRERFDRIMPGGHYDTAVRNLRAAVAIAEQSETHIVPCIVVMNDVLDSLVEYVQFLADLGIRRVILQKLYPQTRKLEELDPFSRRNGHDLEEIFSRVLERAKQLGIFVETNIAQLFGDPGNQSRSISKFDILQENVHIVDLFAPGFCMSTATQALIECDGTVLPCVKDRIILGNINRSDFAQIWNGAQMQALRSSFFESRLRAYCSQCKEFYCGHP